jgi:hypothetical protein
MASWSCFHRATTNLIISVYLDEDFAALAAKDGLVHVRDVNAFISKVLVFDKRL